MKDRFFFKNMFLQNKEFIIGLVLTLSLLWPLFAGSYFSHHDDVQVIRTFEMAKCFEDGQIPCRWVPDLGGLYGYPIFNYYAPLPYYFGYLIYFFTNSLLVSAKFMFAFSFVASFVFMYLFSSKYWGKLGGSLSAIFYIFAPYHALDFYVRGAMGEMWGLMFFPAILWASTKLAEKINLSNTLLLGVFVALLITSHNLSALLFLPLSILWMLLLYIKNKNNKLLWYSLCSFILGIALSAFYLFPMIAEKDLVHVDTTTFGYFSYTEHFKGLRKVVLDRSWGWGASVREVPGGEREGLSYQIGWVHLLGWILALFASYKLWQKNKWTALVIIFSSAVILLSIFMIHPRSVFLWNLIEPLKYLQFPWRFLMPIIFFISFISGSLFLKDLKYKRIIWIGLIALVVILNFAYFRPEKFIKTNDKDYLSGSNWDKQIKRSIFDYLPIYAKAPPAELATQRYELITGDSRVYDFKEGTNWVYFKTDTKTHSIIRLSQYYFPQWKVLVDGKEVQLDYKNNPLGLMTFILGKGEHIVEGRLHDTQVRFISNILSLVSIISVLFLFLIQLRLIKKWLVYYRERIS